MERFKFFIVLVLWSGFVIYYSKSFKAVKDCNNSRSYSCNVYKNPDFGTRIQYYCKSFATRDQLCNTYMHLFEYRTSSSLSQLNGFWTSWIDRHHPTKEHAGSEFEYFTDEEVRGLCHGDALVMDIECVPTDNGLMTLKQDVVCDPHKGLHCLGRDNLPDGCVDYRVRYRIRCQTGQRRKRNLPETCNSWYPWVNENHPSPDNNFSDKEVVSHTKIAEFCPPSLGGVATKFECADNGGEARQGGQITDTTTYNGTCTGPTEGLQCWVLNNNVGSKCPDLKFRFYCECPQERISTPFSEIKALTSYTRLISDITEQPSLRTASVATSHQVPPFTKFTTAVKPMLSHNTIETSLSYHELTNGQGQEGTPETTNRTARRREEDKDISFTNQTQAHTTSHTDNTNGVNLTLTQPVTTARPPERGSVLTTELHRDHDISTPKGHDPTTPKHGELQAPEGQPSSSYTTQFLVTQGTLPLPINDNATDIHLSVKSVVFNTTAVRVEEDKTTFSVIRYLPFIIAASCVTVFLPLLIVTLIYFVKYFKVRYSKIRPARVSIERNSRGWGRNQMKRKTTDIDFV